MDGGIAMLRIRYVNDLKKVTLLQDFIGHIVGAQEPVPLIEKAQKLGNISVPEGTVNSISQSNISQGDQIISVLTPSGHYFVYQREHLEAWWRGIPFGEQLRLPNTNEFIGLSQKPKPYSGYIISTGKANIQEVANNQGGGKLRKRTKLTKKRKSKRKTRSRK